MWNGKQKAVTFSYDDGVKQDKKLVELFNYYKVKATFNLNSGLMSEANCWQAETQLVKHMNYAQLRDLYQGHEIASHGLSHANLTEQSEETMESEVLLDKLFLESLFQRPVMGFAYPFGAFSEKTEQILRNHGICYARTVNRTGRFDLPESLLQINPTCHHDDTDVFELISDFLESESETPQLFYLWGHSYEFDVKNNWNRMEQILDQLAGKNNIFYGTNAEILV